MNPSIKSKAGSSSRTFHPAAQSSRNGLLSDRLSNDNKHVFHFDMPLLVLDLGHQTKANPKSFRIELDSLESHSQGK